MSRRAQSRPADRARGRAAATKARRLLDGAIRAHDRGDIDTALGSFVEAAVLASDALCIFARGEYSVGQDHSQALQTLRSVEGGAALSKALGTALQAKKQHVYEVGLPKNSEMVALRRAAERLVQVAESRM